MALLCIQLVVVSIYVTSSLQCLKTERPCIVVSPTISLILDQVTNLKEKGINAVYLGSAQLDLSVENHALSPESDINLVFVTPEWISKSQK